MLIARLFIKRRNTGAPMIWSMMPLGLRAVAEAVAVQIERTVVAPIVAVSALAPVEKARADVFDLAFVVDKGIVVQGRALRWRR